MLVAGATVLGWQLVGTNWVSQQRQADTVERLERSWERGGSGEVAAGGSRATAVVRIPRFGSDYAVPLLEGTSDAVLATGYGHFRGTAEAGARGNFAVAAHRVTHGEPLRDMPSLQPGDEVVVQTARWTYTYELTTGGDDLVVPFTQTWVLDRLPTNPSGGVQPPQRPGQRLITITTCSELFHTDDRMIAFGVLTDKQPTTP